MGANNPKGVRQIDVVRAARALVDAHRIGDTAAAKVAGVTTRAIQKWRAAVDTNDALREEYHRVLAKKDDAWVKERTSALRVVLQRAIKLAAKETDLDKLTRFIEKVGGVDVIDAELSKAHASSTQSPGEGAASPDDRDEAEEGERAPAH